MLEREEAFYQAHKEDICAKYAGKRLLIVGDKILGVFDTDTAAAEEALKTMRWEDDFMIKAVPQTPEDEIVYIAPIIQPLHYARPQI
jgi:hypothetical protein